MSMDRLPSRYNYRHSVTVLASDWRTHPDTPSGYQHFYGTGNIHYDIVNVPFYGRMYDTAVIAHPLSPFDHLALPKISLMHIQYVLSQLRDIQRQCRNDLRTTLGELRARQESIEILKELRVSALQKHMDRYYAQQAYENPRIMHEGLSEDYPVQAWKQEEGVSPRTQTAELAGGMR